MKLRVSHATRYQYASEVSLAPHIIYLRPRETPLLRLRNFSLNISPSAKITHVSDYHDNTLTWAHFWDPASSLSVRTEFEIETLATNPFDFILRSTAVAFPFEYDPAFRSGLAAYLAPPPPDVRLALANWLDEHFIDRPSETVPLVTALNQFIYNAFTYRRREECGIQPSLETIRLGTGSCRDFAVLLAELFRTLGLAARFVSGYLFAPPEDSHRSAGAMHAWVEVYLPGAGWRGLDPTHGIFCDDAFVPVAHAALADAVNPIQGAYYTPNPVVATLRTDVLVENLLPHP